MAKTQLEAAGTSGCQFFVVTGDGAQLAPDYALLGKITGGQADGRPHRGRRRERADRRAGQPDPASTVGATRRGAAP